MYPATLDTGLCDAFTGNSLWWDGYVRCLNDKNSHNRHQFFNLVVTTTIRTCIQTCPIFHHHTPPITDILS